MNNQLNAEVTVAITEARNADWLALYAWRRVLAAEKALAETLPEGLEKEIAERGVISAAERCTHLEEILK